MSCVDIQRRIPELIEGSLPDDERAILEAHISGCPACSGERRTLSVLLSELKEDAPWIPPGAYWNNLLPRIHERIAAKDNSLFPYVAWLPRFAALAAAIVMILISANIVPTSFEERPSDVNAIAHQVPVEEIQDYASRQDILGFAEVGESVSENAVITPDDEDGVRQLIGAEDASMDENDAIESVAKLPDNSMTKLIAQLDRNIEIK